MACQEPTTASDEVGEPGTDGDGDGDGDADNGADDESPDGDGDGEPGDGDGEAGDGDGEPGDGDGDGDQAGALLRLLHLGVDVPAVDVYFDNEPMAESFEFESGTDYVTVPPGAHEVTITPAGDPDTPMLTIAPLDLVNGVKYSAVAYDYLANFSALALIDDDSNIDPANTRLQLTHAALDVGQIDVWTLADPPVLLIEDLDVGATKQVDVPAGPRGVGIDIDDDAIVDMSFGVPDLGAGELIDIYAVNEAGGSPVFLLTHMPDGSTARIDKDVCGDAVVTGLEVCDGDELGGLSCTDLGEPMGTLKCLPDCSDYDLGLCVAQVVICDDVGAKIPEKSEVTLTLNVADVGTVADVRVSVDITHPWLSDLDVTLDKDGMNTTAMFTDILDIGGKGCIGNNMIAMLDDDTAKSIQSDACANANIPAVDGTYTPKQPLSNFDGMSMAGSWTLTLEDDNKGDFGTINQWCLYIVPE